MSRYKAVFAAAHFNQETMLKFSQIWNLIILYLFKFEISGLETDVWSSPGFQWETLVNIQSNLWVKDSALNGNPKQAYETYLIKAF